MGKGYGLTARTPKQEQEVLCNMGSLYNHIRSGMKMTKIYIEYICKTCGVTDRIDTHIYDIKKSEFENRCDNCRTNFVIIFDKYGN